MKVIRFLLILCMFFQIDEAISQIEPPVLELKGLTPNWHYISVDTNFIQSDLDPFSSKYWGRSASDFKVKNGNLFILEYMVSQSPYTGREGYLLHCLDNSTGDIKWVHHNNSYVGYQYREWLNAEAFTFLDDGNIQILTYKDIDSIDFTVPKFTFFASPKKKIIDANSGITISEKFGDKLVPEQYNVTNGVSRVTTTGDGDIIQIIPNIYNESNSLKNSIVLYDIGEDMNIIAPPTASIVYDTEVNIGTFASFSPLYFRLNKDTIVGLFSSPDPTDDMNSPDEVILSWINISEKDAFIELSKIDITDQVYYPQSAVNENIFCRTVDNTIFVYQNILQTNGAPIETSNFNWLAWFDHNGNLLSHIPFFGEDERYYRTIRPMGVKDGVAYVAGYLNGVYDICKIEPGNNEINVIGSMEVVNFEDIERIYMSLSQFIPNDEIIIGLRVTKENDQGRNTTFEYYYNFPVSELGLITSVEDDPIANNNISIYPNPASNTLKIDASRDGIIEIFDALGQNVHTEKITSNSYIDVNLMNYSSGFYGVVFTSKNGNVNREKLLICK